MLVTDFPPQVFSTEDCSARAKEKDTFQGASGMYSAIAWMCCVASSSDWPPDRKVMPAIVGGTVSFITSSVYLATYGCPISIYLTSEIHFGKLQGTRSRLYRSKQASTYGHFLFFFFSFSRKCCEIVQKYRKSEEPSENIGQELDLS